MRGEKRWRVDGHWIGARLPTSNCARLAGEKMKSCCSKELQVKSFFYDGGEIIQ